jgi:hypothetical protein
MENVLRLLLAETSTLSAASGSAPENKLGMHESLFTLQVLDPAFENWIRCDSSAMLELHITDMQVAPFRVHPWNSLETPLVSPLSRGPFLRSNRWPFSSARGSGARVLLVAAALG